MRCPTCDTVLYLRDFPGYMDKILYCDKCYAYWPKVRSANEIEKLHEQNAALKAALVQERADALAGCEYEPPKTMNDLRAMATCQLARELGIQISQEANK